ncbi:uncharacterized protein BCR38DRAFT_107084 [Pseudomassariella vexata]|uniref:Zn(2)-C6 fungal-type domain-containing protein n=1 Tax=Pseudomassariella vexata TaxID=1141098 RepID=A0A1Y2EGM6_9PEZI|nr:uncharacterized protein BCR38DRAFT_107084 [Pseudomassariella vexata]ORY70454.1 hypothetical protein BCR38DRAFT_107084 [Pseudomassariella vexata]
MAELVTNPGSGSGSDIKRDRDRERERDDERLAACFSCKRSKLKCVRTNGSATCNRCRQRRIDCAAPAYHVGRHKGVKNKHSGLEKAVYQIEQALKRGPGPDQVQNLEQASELRFLLERSRELLGSSSGANQGISGEYSASSNGEKDQRSSPHRTETSLHTPRSQSGGPHIEDSPAHKIESDQLNLDDAENPLQLLARTSELLSSISRQASGPGASRFASKPTAAVRGFGLSGEHDHDIQSFFGRFQPRLDIGAELDPIELGLMSLAEAESLFSYFYDKLAHTRWGIDPVIHTVGFVRGRSAFLLTSIAAASALFSPSMESLHKRLSIHRQKLASLVMANRYKSVEIILAFMVNIPWISAGEHWADDETSTYISMALTIALDLSLNKIILPLYPDARTPRDSVASSDCISATKALGIDGLGHVDPNSLAGKRFVRRRERTWLSLFVLERGICLARGRDNVLPMSPLITTCDQWHLSDLADRWDGSIVSVVVLRRDLANLIARVRAICDAYVDTKDGDSIIVDRLKGEITHFFDRWYQTWPLQIGDREQLSLPPYVEILASHTRLSMYSSVVNHTTAPMSARHFFRAAGLSSALNVLRVAVQGEGQLKTMPNNTAIMISFAACFALRVSTVADGRGSSLAPSIRTLILETTDVLDRIGETPVQRKGLSCLFARQLREILKLATRGQMEQPASRDPHAYPHPHVHDHNQAQGQVHGRVAGYPAHMHAHSHVAQNPVAVDMPQSSVPPDYLLFSTMSNDQLDEAINNTDVGLEALWEDFQFQNGTDLDWMDWSTFA